MPSYSFPTDKLRVCGYETFSLLNSSGKNTLYYATDITLAKRFPEVKGYGAAVLNCIELREFLERYEVETECHVTTVFEMLTKAAETIARGQ